MWKLYHKDFESQSHWDVRRNLQTLISLLGFLLSTAGDTALE